MQGHKCQGRLKARAAVEMALLLGDEQCSPLVMVLSRAREPTPKYFIAAVLLTVWLRVTPVTLITPSLLTRRSPFGTRQLILSYISGTVSRKFF